MTQPADATPGPQARGRYRFQGDQPLDPDAGVHPEMASEQAAVPVADGVPNSPHDLIAMQSNRAERPEKPEHQRSPKVKEVLELIKALETSPAEDQQISLFLVRQLENFHDEVVGDMRDDENARHSQIVRWAIDADRLYRARMLLENVELE